MTADPESGPGYRLRMGTADVPPLSIVMFPQQSVLASLRQMASGQSCSGSADPLVKIDKALRPTARFASQSFAARSVTVMPECCAPIPPLADTSVGEQAGRLRDMAADVLTEELQAGHGDHAFAPQWRVPAQQPRRWLNSLADASLDAWAVIEPRWRAAGPLFDREVRRVGTAMVRGGTAALLNNLHPRISYADGILSFAVPQDRCVTLGSRSLALLPMIAKCNALAVSFEHPDVCYIAYPLNEPGTGTKPAVHGAL